MTNHVHLFIEEKEAGDIKTIMHKVLSNYVGWFNYKYQRSGSLIGNRYKSEPIGEVHYKKDSNGNIILKQTKKVLTL